MRDLILFGAGASLGASQQDGPPLVRSLLDELVVAKPGSWGALATEEQEAFRRDFEGAMAVVLSDSFKGRWTFPLTDTELKWSRLQWDLAEFFYAFDPKPENLYAALVARVQSADAFDRVRIATLNYDRLLCSSANGLGIRCHFGFEGTDRDLRVCLPHGAAFVAPTANIRNDLRGLAIGGSGPIELTGIGPIFQLNTPNVEILHDRESFRAKRERSVYPPVMSYIEPAKFTASGGGFLDRQHGVYRKWVGEAERVAIIGVNIHVSDSHIWEPLRSAAAKLLYVALSGRDFTAWAQDNGRKDDPDAIVNTWAEAFEEVCVFLDV